MSSKRTGDDDTDDQYWIDRAEAARNNGEWIGHEQAVEHVTTGFAEASLESQREFGQEQARQLQEFQKEFGTLPDSVEGIRQERDES